MAFALASRPSVRPTAAARPAARQVRVQCSTAPQMKAALGAAAVAASLVFGQAAYAADPLTKVENAIAGTDFKAEARATEARIEESKEKLNERFARDFGGLEKKVEQVADNAKNLPSLGSTPIVQKLEGDKSAPGTAADKAAKGPSSSKSFF